MLGTKEIRDAHIALEDHLVGANADRYGDRQPGCACAYAFVNAAAVSDLLAPNRLCEEGRTLYERLRTLVSEYKASNGA